MCRRPSRQSTSWSVGSMPRGQWRGGALHGCRVPHALSMGARCPPPRAYPHRDRVTGGLRRRPSSQPGRSHQWVGPGAREFEWRTIGAPLLAPGGPHAAATAGAGAPLGRHSSLPISGRHRVGEGIGGRSFGEDELDNSILGKEETLAVRLQQSRGAEP